MTQSISQFYSLLSLVFMMSFVIVFDNMHWRKLQLRRLCAVDLLSRKDLDRLYMILSACQDA
jgi:hypothetical protein